MRRICQYTSMCTSVLVLYHVSVVIVSTASAKGKQTPAHSISIQIYSGIVTVWLLYYSRNITQGH